MHTPSVSDPPARLISIAASPSCELARWLLDRQRIAYVEACHAPVLHRWATRRFGGTSTVPVLATIEGTFATPHQIIDYLQTCPDGDALWPADPSARAQAEELFALVDGELSGSVRDWALAQLLPERQLMVRLWGSAAPLHERLLLQAVYPLLASAVRRAQGIGPQTIMEQRARITAVFDRVGALLHDGRPYLTGDTPAVADFALAARAAPAVLPAEYGGALLTLDELPAPMRAEVSRFRDHPAGQFILRLYREQRPRSARLANTADTLAAGSPLMPRFNIWAPNLQGLRAVSALLRRFAPILVVGKRVVVSRHADALEVLTRDTDFTIAEVNAKRFEQLQGRFILSMDRSSEYERDEAILRQVVRADDLERIRRFVVATAADLVDASGPRGRIDVVGGLTRVVPTRLIATYFGVPGPDEHTVMRWMRELFYHAFFNFADEPTARQAGVQSTAELTRFLEEDIVRRRADPAANGRVDDMLGRLLALQGDARPWLDDEWVCRNVAGVIVGVVEPTSKFVTLAIDELLRRPEPLHQARTAALAGDLETVRAYAYEAVRFNPHTPVLLRHCPRETTLAAGTARARRIPAGSSVVVGAFSAMFDPEAFADPNAFRIDRGVEYLHFGYGLHRCFGLAINNIQVPALVASLLRLPGLRRATEPAGQVLYAGPFPDRLVLEFDRDAVSTRG